MGMRGVVGGMVMLAAAGSAVAKPGDLIDTLHHDDAPPLTILDFASAQPCAAKSGLCIAAGARSTIAVAAQPVAPADETATNVKAPAKPGPLLALLPRFSRAAS